MSFQKKSEAEEMTGRGKEREGEGEKERGVRRRE